MSPAPAAAGRPHQLRVVRLGDDPADWSAAGFSVVEGPDGTGRVRLGSTVLELTGSGAEVEGWALDGVAADLDGLPTVGMAPDDAPAGNDHPNGVVGIDHVVVLTGDGRRTLDALGAAGLDLRRQRATSMAGRPVRQSFLWAGDVVIEVVAPDGETVPGETDAGETVPGVTVDVAPGDGPATLFGLALVAEDLDATATFLGPALGPPRPAVQPGRRIASLRHRPRGTGLPVVVMSPHPRDRGQ